MVILTDWNQFRRLDLQRLGEIMKGRQFFDFRNMYHPIEIYNAGFYYEGVGKTLMASPGSLFYQVNDLGMDNWLMSSCMVERN